MTEFLLPAEMSRQIPSGCKLGLPPDGNGVSPGMIRHLIQAGVSDLHIVCAPIGGLATDMLIGAGAVSAVETSAVSLGAAGGAPCFSRAVKSATVKLLDATCPAILAGLTAARKGVPFMAIRGLIGTDILRNRPDWRIIENPFEPGDKIVVVPAIRPDVALFHAPEADRFGNVRVGRRRELMLLAYASKRNLVSVERIVDRCLLDDEREAAGVLPALYVNAVAEYPNGAWPSGLSAEYAPDEQEMARYARLARSEDGFQEYMRNEKEMA